ncbi:serine/threonine-protein kinase [Acrocarpospora catenulata]|uniref:serine/threonine-protein kinase n=1 Tax=Acrocarpospora catenulata TaxID=2836182 RepID=UPI001BDA6E1E|nr:serine/threonine-protein kinase [Acrocarpospora catenulata]
MEEPRRLAGRYQLIERIGRGGMGVVWRAHDELLDRAVAVKEVLYSPMSEEDRIAFNRRTIREARAAGRLSHPNVIVVHDVVEEDGRPWIVMQLVRSRSLGEVVREHGPIIPERAAAIGLQILDALCTAHAAGILHRDVKPENVLLTGDNRVVLTDFGIATMVEEPGLTITGGLTGTPAFMPPERLMGHPATPESDLWSLGATIYAAVEGRSPYERVTPIASMAAVLQNEPDPAHRAGPLAPVLEGLLRKNPEQRIDAVEAEELLKRAAAGIIPTPRHPAASPHTPPPVPAWQHPSPALPPHQSLPPGVPHPSPPPGVPPYQIPPVAVPPHPTPQNAVTPRSISPWTPAIQEPRQVTADPVPPPRPPGRPKALLLLIPVLALALVAGGWYGYQTLFAESPRLTTTNVSSPSPADTPADETTPSPTPSARPTRQLPPGWRNYRDELGFAIALPPGWAATDRQETRVRFRGPGMDGYLQVDLTPWEETDPVAALETVERNSTERGLLPGYQKISLEPGEYKGVPAADWEFTFRPSSGPQRVIDRAFKIEETCYALYWQVPERRWSTGLSYFDTFAATFRPT